MNADPKDLVRGIMTPAEVMAWLKIKRTKQIGVAEAVPDSVEPWGFIYFIEAEGLNLIKIGWTRIQPRKRLATLNATCPVPLRPLGVLRCVLGVEATLHGLWGDLRRKGEWFEASPELLEFIRNVAGPWPAVGELIPLPHHRYPGLGVVQPPPRAELMEFSKGLPRWTATEHDRGANG
jgi:hypothetical protein